MEYADLYKKLVNTPQIEIGMALDAFELLKSLDRHDLTEGLSVALQKEMTRLVEIENLDNAKAYKDLYYRLMRWDAPYSYESFLIAMEFDREPNRRFYLPRKRVLKPVVDAIQKLSDGELDELFISCPPRVGKTALSTFYVCWLLGKDPELANLYVTYTASIAAAFYDGILEIINDPTTYNWHDIFPNREIATTNAKDGTLDIDRKKKYHSFTARSLYGTLNGSTDVTGIEILDDLLSGIEEAVNPERLMTAWNHVDNNALTRLKSGAKVMWIGTRWSIADPIGRRLDVLQNANVYKDHRYKVFSIPALNSNDESNFVYQYNLGFSTEYFHQRRASFENNNDMASFCAQFMCEPIEREGVVFSPDDFRYFNGELPENPDRIYMVIDPAFGGGDFTAATICYQYGEDVYIPDVLYSNLDKSFTQPMIAHKVEEWKIPYVKIEASKTVKPYVEGVEQAIKDSGLHASVVSVPASPLKAKKDRIYEKSPDIRKNFMFLSSGHWAKEYSQFMANVFSFKYIGKNKHDDAPDVLSATAEEAFKRRNAKAEIFARPF